MNITLYPHLESLIRVKVKSSHFNSASEAINAALSLMEERDHLREIRLEELRRDIQRGIDSGSYTALDI
jgi:antitoxin ParD1/3/4